MFRPGSIGVPLALALGLGCSLLTPYPGGEDPNAVLGGGGSGGTLEGGDQQEPLVDPAVDPSIGVTRNITTVVAHPGSAFPIDLDFDAPGMNVVGGGIRFDGSDEVQWTFIQGLEDEITGNISFGYVVDQEICAQVPNLCHEIQTEQFAVARNTMGDVDGDGVDDGEFVVSRPVEVTVVLMCATCESPSCSDLLPEGECQSCGQPDVCGDYFDRCLDPATNPNVTIEDAAFFEGIFGPNGALWTTPSGCVSGEQACKGAEEEGMECRLGGGEGGDESSGGGSDSGGTGS